MAKITEKRLYAVQSQLLTSNGNNVGEFEIADSSILTVGQIIKLASNTQETLTLKVKRIPNRTMVVVGPADKPVGAYSNISAYLVADGAYVFAEEQLRPVVPQQEIERLTYEEEPVIARRSVLVDRYGDKYTQENPIPTSNQPYDDVQIEYDPDTQDMSEARFYRSGVLLYTLTMEYDDSGNLIRVQRE